MTIWWMVLPQTAVPTTTSWLAPRERETSRTLTVTKRREDWLLGRYVTKYALTRLEGLDRLDVIDIVAAEDGAPEAFTGARRLPFHISISHRNQVGACSIARAGPVGCDLEVIEPRTSRFVEDYFTRSERLFIDRCRGQDRLRLIALTWSAKESALKALRIGLRRDTRKVHVRFPPSEESEGWSALDAYIEPEGRTLFGWWRQIDELVLTVLSSDGPRTTTPVAVPEAPSAPPTNAQSAPGTESS